MNTDRPIHAEPTGSPQGAGSPVPPLTARRSLASFTLIELLVVVAVILILFGISLKMMSVVGRKSGIAKTLYVLEQTRNALDAYYATMGSYPNTTDIVYDRFNNAGRGSWGFDASASLHSTLGLSYYIRYEPHPRSESWQKFARTVVKPAGSYTNPPISKVGFDSIMTTNVMDSIRDAWDRDIVYVPNAKCDGYILYSKGPDAAIPLDDIGIDKNE